jgi:hypothetical protein
MAIIDDTTEHDLAGKIKELKTIDINDTSLPEGKEETINPSADAWERACPPPDGVYLVKIHESKIAYQQGKTDDGEYYYVANIECKIQDNEEWKDVIIFGKVSTYIGAGKEISTMAGLIVKFGVKVQSNVTHLALVKLLKKVLAKEPKLYVEGEWKAWDMPANQWIKQGMKTFPKLEAGGFNHVVRDSKGGTVTAKFKPVKWWALKDYRDFIEKEKVRKAQQKSNQTAQGSQGSSTSKANGEVVENFQEVPNAGGAIPNKSSNVIDEDFVIEE